MKRRHEKGIMWIIAIIFVCFILMYVLKNYSSELKLVENTGSVSVIDNDISVTDSTGDRLKAKEQEDLWILFDHLLFEREENPVRTILISILLIGYIIVIGPLVYFFLKKRDKMEWMWVMLPSAAVLFAAVIMVLGDGFAAREPMVDSLTVISPRQNDIVYLASTSPGRDAYSLEFVDQVDRVTPLYVSGQYEIYDGQVIQTEELYDVEMTTDGISINLDSRKAFSKDYFRLDLDHDHSGEIQCDFTVKDGVLTGTMTNNTEWNFSSVLICYQKKYKVLPILRKENQVTVTADDWYSLEDVWLGLDERRIGSSKNNAHILNFAYLKYYDGEEETAKCQIAAVIPRYEFSLKNVAENVISSGLFYQYENVK